MESFELMASQSAFEMATFSVSPRFPTEISSHRAQGEWSPALDIIRSGTIVIQIYCVCVCVFVCA